MRRSRRRWPEPRASDDSHDSRALLRSRLQACPHFRHRLGAIDKVARLCLQPAALNLPSPPETDFVVLLEKSQAFADDLACIIVKAALDLSVDELLELRSQRHV